jgi:hypothetical protein
MSVSSRAEPRLRATPAFNRSVKRLREVISGLRNMELSSQQRYWHTVAV